MEQTFLRYRDFKAADFLQDAAFSDYVLLGDRQNGSFWKELEQVYPHLAQEMEMAKVWILLIRNQPLHTGAPTATERWVNIQEQLPIYARKRMRPTNIRKAVIWGLRLAAVWIAVFFVFELSSIGTKHAQTVFGERKEMVLPDGSEVQLNSNTKISYVRGLKSDKPREVWLEGEALFDVKRTVVRNRINQDDYFIVHAGGLHIRVLGTTFNVKNRRNTVEVSLVEGQIELTDDNGVHKILAAGETFEYHQDGKVAALKTDPLALEASVAWSQGELVVEHYSLADVMEIIEDNYGYQVEVADSAMLDRKLEGTIPVKSINDILFVIKHTLGVKITKENNTLFIHEH